MKYLVFHPYSIRRLCLWLALALVMSACGGLAMYDGQTIPWLLFSLLLYCVAAICYCMAGVELAGLGDD